MFKTHVHTLIGLNLSKSAKLSLLTQQIWTSVNDSNEIDIATAMQVQISVFGIFQVCNKSTHSHCSIETTSSAFRISNT